MPEKFSKCGQIALGFDPSKNAPNPKPVGGDSSSHNENHETFSQVPSVIPALPPDPEQDLFLSEIPQKDGAGGSEKVCKKKRRGFCDVIPNCFLCVFLIRNQVFEWCINHHMFKQN